METMEYSVDKLYDIHAEFWDATLDPSELSEWNLFEKELPNSEVILQDRLMSDTVLEPRPIKSEHSYSLASDGDSLPDSPISSNTKIDDMEDECYPAISMNTACGVRLGDEIDIKDEPYSETDSMHSSCPSSPQHESYQTYESHLDVKPQMGDEFFNTSFLTNDSSDTKSVLKSTACNVMLTATNNIFTSQQHIQLAPKLSIKVDGNAFHLPPTPPSCSSSEESEDNLTTISQPASPGGGLLVRTKGTTAARVLLAHHSSSTRQPIHTPLISTQPKGSTGSLTLTEEEKRTLIAEGYPVPTRLPLTKAEEKSLKKIRRKIKNKISAQESRRKKKEYMDQLERKVEVLVSENTDYRKQIRTLEGSNTNLLGQLAKLQAIVARTHPHLVKKNKLSDH